MSLEGAVVIVAGASGGIGSSVVHGLLARGARTYGLVRERTSALTGAVEIVCDCTDPQSVVQAVNQIAEQAGRIDGLVHCIGDIFETIDVSEMDSERVLRSMRLNLGTAVDLTSAVSPWVRASGGSIVYVSSIASFRVYPGIADYCASKAALTMYMRCVARDLASSGARANCVSPAVVDTELFQRSPYSIEEAAQWHALGRVGQPHDVEQAILWLLDIGASGWVTGTDLILDGGMTL